MTKISGLRLVSLTVAWLLTLPLAASAESVQFDKGVTAGAGIFSDGWITPGATLSFRGDAHTCALLCIVDIDGIAPDAVAEITVINGGSYRQTVRLRAGRHRILLPFSAVASENNFVFNGPARCVLPPPDQRRVLARLITVKPITLQETQQMPLADFGLFDTVATQGITSDGWAGTYATFDLPTGRLRHIKLRVEYPGWATHDFQNVEIVCGKLPLVRATLIRGIHELDLELPESISTITFRCANSFRLPDPDNRMASLRLISFSPKP